MVKNVSVKSTFQDFKNKLIDEESNKKIVALGVFILLGMFALIMTVMNIATEKEFLLTVTTGAFAFLSIVNIFLALFGKSALRVSLWLFTVEIIAMITIFIISGYPEGFSALWALMLPSFGMLLYGREAGTAVSGVMMLDIIFLLWTPMGKDLLMYEYNETFKMRFPVLFIGFYFLAFLLEMLRTFTYEKMKELQQMYKEQSVKDHLTGIYNRQGFNTAVREQLPENSVRPAGMVIFDLDHFKKINDTYGHATGDGVLTGFAKLVRSELNMIVCRWGGEEFAGVYFDHSLSIEDFERFREEVENHTFECCGNKIRITVSTGICETERLSLENMEKISAKADVALYTAKNTGRNKVIMVKGDKATAN